jgi:hypothetical protein
MSNQKKFQKQQLIECLKNFSIRSQTDSISKKDIDDDLTCPSSSTFKRYFGSWGEALRLAGLKTGKITGRPSDPPIVVSNGVLEVINGELLGDGSLYLTGTFKSNACFSHSTSKVSYGQYLYNKLSEMEVPLLKPDYLPARNNGKPQFRTRTSANQFWTNLRNQWYTENEKKVIPISLELTKEVCLHWYLGDGYFEQGTSKISTCGFNKEENERLSSMLNQIGFKTGVNKRSGGYYIIRFSKNSYRDFLSWIGPCPVTGYEHRWGI